MSLDSVKDFLSHLSARDLPTGVAVLAGIVLLVLIFKAGKTFTKILFLLISLGLFASAYWWHTHK